MAVSSKKRPVRNIVLIFISVFIGLFAAKFGMYAFNNRPGAVEAEFEQAVQNDATVGPMFQAMQQYFPADYAALKTEMATQHRAGASNQMLTQLGFQRLAAFRSSHLRDLAQAPSTELAAFRKSQAALIDQLAQESQSMCARFTFATLSPTDQPSPAGQKALAEFGAVQFRAIAAGQKTPAKRPTDAPQQKDAQALVAQMKAQGLSEQQMSAFLRGGTGLTEAEKCKTGVTLSKALAKLPTDQADRITAVMVSNS
ncbi:hypothetical protein [Sphingomonas xinjiangensis]|uniref:Uncharacterized protein n=1 Tax=Sphingomonas xinjiangensis TaxID=643568 RepID=A0A840Y9Z9_9SPHN|nr:hypothetical protein [Sphingomonas xinjiangensis]MBB5710157.1 hypothetical protein [Sphingomonas xinjiangensis]